jgi:uncharacterized damage-inducible protein DinB
VSDHLRPGPNEHAPYYAQYVAAAGSGDPLESLEAQLTDIDEVLGSLTDAQAGFRYAPGKWTIRQVLSHMSDAERVFAYRALRFGRGDETPLPGFDQTQWEAFTNADARDLSALVAEFRAIRAASIQLFRGLPPEAFTRGGVASDNPVTVRALLYIMLGHVAHHLGILRERYLSSPAFPR